MADILHGLDEMIRLRQRWSRLMGGEAAELPPLPAHLTELTDFGSNPGALRMLEYRPEGLPPGAPLVVALHGCTQDAAGYERGCGWSVMAERLGFAMLLPEQRRENNSHLCFNWFEPADVSRGAGEVASIQQGVEAMLQRHGLDRRRVFISGLSAGGAMTVAMLATYPEVFAGGAVLAGLPYGAARSAGQALDAMFHPALRPAEERAAAVRAASPHRGAWPRLSVWQGLADETVAPGNADELVKQWAALHGLDPTRPDELVQEDGFTRRRWRDAAGRLALEAHAVPKLAHGVPLDVARLGEAGPHLLDVGLSSTHAILEFWGMEAPRDRAFEVNMAGEAREVSPWRLDPSHLLDRALRAAGLRR
ncbi:PHB depolymerase family esterase [Pseudoroseomonas cervicalis]|uniref:extracellular catalytic domain type 1 short-chain-length polyhydroxyalkanoate depolymerase n=1 Tax=Teichococcus cervicalis TaxID=204525 RepID=UPI0022F1C2DA|nr:PHB depolymerase family esterase [Pseudoroseomonas cervicalis]WBV45331.1 PHB depolymerase family esterase [Pseudoroseomonas cervicalis]